MTRSTISVEATLQPDGVTLHLDRKLALPAGRVTLIVHPLAVPGSGATMLDTLERIHHDQLARGRRAPTEEETAAEIAKMRRDDDEYEAHWHKIWSETQTNPKSTEHP